MASFARYATFHLFPPKWFRITRNSQFHQIYNFSNLFPLKRLRMTRNGQFCLICNFSNLFPPKWFRITWNSQFHPICSFSNLFPLKWLRMTRNGQFCMAKKKNTMIQGNFYERLHFYMDSCAISPTASLFNYSASTNCSYYTKMIHALSCIQYSYYVTSYVTLVKWLSQMPF